MGKWFPVHRKRFPVARIWFSVMRKRFPVHRTVVTGSTDLKSGDTKMEFVSLEIEQETGGAHTAGNW